MKIEIQVREEGQRFHVGDKVEFTVGARRGTFELRGIEVMVDYPGAFRNWTYTFQSCNPGMVDVEPDIEPEASTHLTDYGTFKSDKYDWCPEDFFALKFSDPAARTAILCYAAGTDDPELASALRTAVEVARGRGIGERKA